MDPANAHIGDPLDALTAFWLAWVIALLWAVHPLQTEAVTYLSQRVESLMGLFYLLTLYGFIRGARAQGSSGFWFAVSIVACLLGMATKEVMVTAPVLVLLYDRTFLAGTFRRALSQRWRYYAAAAGTWCLLALLVWRTGTRGGTAGFGSGVSWWAYALTQIRAVAHYLRLAIWPHPLIADYGRILGGPTGEILVDLVVLAVLAGLTAWALWRRPRWGFLGAWFFVILLPSSSVVPVSTEIIAERRMYLPLAAVLAALVLGIYFAARALARSQGWAFRPLALGLGIFGLLTASALAAATVARNRVYQSVETLWSDVVANAPENAGAWNNLGNALAEKPDLKEAESRYREALRLVPAYADAHVNLGNLLLRTGRPDEAVEHYQQALPFRPEDASLRRALGVAAYRSGNAHAEAGHPAESVGYNQIAIAMTPDSVDAHVNFGSTLAELGRNAEALREFQAALQLEPGSADIHNNLGGLLAQDGRWAEAEAQFEAALRLQPDFPAARNNLEQLRQIMKSRGVR